MNEVLLAIYISKQNPWLSIPDFKIRQRCIFLEPGFLHLGWATLAKVPPLIHDLPQALLQVENHFLWGSGANSCNYQPH